MTLYSVAGASSYDDKYALKNRTCKLTFSQNTTNQRRLFYKVFWNIIYNLVQLTSCNFVHVHDRDAENAKKGFLLFLLETTKVVLVI
jgi:competence transcription factor ComK